MKAHARRLGRGGGPWSGSMGGRGGLAVDEAGRAGLERLGRSAARREADRARAVLRSPDGGTGATIAARLGVRAGQVRRWRSAVRSGGVAALRARPRPGRAPSKREAALAVARDLLAAPVADRPVWTLARLAAEIPARPGGAGSPGHPSGGPRKGGTPGVGPGPPPR